MADLSGILASIFGPSSGSAGAAAPGGVLSAPSTVGPMQYDEEGNPIGPAPVPASGPQLDPEGNPINATASTPGPAPASGDFWHTKNPDGTSSYLGGLITYDPSKDQAPGNRLGLFGAAMQDAGANFTGHPADATNLQAFMRQNKAAAAKQAVVDAQASGDPAQIKSALLNYALAGGDVSSLSDAMNYGKPTLKGIDKTQDQYLIGPDGKPTLIKSGVTKPLVSGGMQSTDNGQTWQPIPGYTAQQSDIYNARDAAAAAHRAPKKAAAPGAITIPHPSSMY